jgi:membrane protein
MLLVQRVQARARAARSRRSWVDHAARAYDRHSEVLGSQVAAAITYFGFLAFFPLLALTFAVVGYVSVFYPDARDGITSAVEGAFPTLVGTGPGKIDLDDVVAVKGGAGLIGLAGLLYAGLGWVDTLRDGLRRVFGTLDLPLSLLRKKAADLLVLVLLGAALLLSVAVSSLATSTTAYVLGTVGLGDSVAATVLLKMLAVALALAVDMVIFAIVFSRLSGARLTWHRLRTGALLGAVGFEVLKLLGTFFIARTTQNPVYATFGVVVGLLLWINLVSRLLVYAAAWTATQAYSLAPGGIGEPGVGRSTGLAAATEPVRAVAPADYEPVPVAADSGSASPGRMRTVRGLVLGAAVGAGLAGALSRRGSRD